MKFINTIRFSPVITDGPPEFPKHSYEWQEWWKEQKRRCIEGYTVDNATECGKSIIITGDHYFYLNFWKVLGKVPGERKKKLISPKFLEMDYDFFWQVKIAKDLGKHLVVAKRRQAGFSEKAASMAGKEFVMFPHSQTLIMSGEEKYAKDTMRKVHRGMNSLKWTEFYKRMNPFTSDFSMARFKNPGDAEWRGYMSELHTITCQNNSQAAIGKTPSFVIFEEAGKFTNLVESFNYIRPALEAEGETTGFALIFGTGGEMGKGADQLMTMFYDPESYGCMPYDDIHSETYDPTDNNKKVGYFVPAWNYLKIDDQGNNLKEESLEYLIAKREIAKKAKHSKTYFDELTQFPIYTEECFLINDGNYFNAAKLNRRLSEVRKSKEISDKKQRGDLIWNRVDKVITGVTWVAKEDGPFMIFEHPETDENGLVPDFLYKLGTDSYDRDAAVGGGFQGSCSVIKGFLNINKTSRKFVARLTIRPETADEFYEMTAKLTMYYNGFNLIEYSNLGIFKWYKNNGFEWMLKERPEVAYANIKDSKMQNKHGIDPQTKHEWLRREKDYVETDVDKIDDEEMLVALLKFRIDPKYNCDITISSSLALIHLEDDWDIEVQEQKKTTTAKFRTGFKLNNGKLIRVYS